MNSGNFKRHTKIAKKRIQKNKNPFVFRPQSSKQVQLWLSKRNAKEERFKYYGQGAILLSILFMISLVSALLSTGIGAFSQTQIQLSFDASKVSTLERSDYRNIIRDSLREAFPEATSRIEKRQLYELISNGGIAKLENTPLTESTDIWLPVSSTIDMYVKGKISADVDEHLRKVSDLQISWITQLQKQGKVRSVFNTDFFTEGDSRNPEEAGILTAVIGSFLTILTCLALAFPFGVASAIYLEEFASKSWFTQLIEININNLAAVPSIIFGLLGLSIYLNYFGMPRSSALVGGLTLALLILPVIVIATRNALQNVPQSVRAAAVALGATDVQVVFHHILPYSLPGIMTGVVLGVARALGETAPLLMIGMMAFIADIPGSITDPTTSLPIQIYLWADSPELGFAERTSAAILVLLGLLILVNLLAMALRKRFEIKW
jgi:phosphate transport system permease protein